MSQGGNGTEGSDQQSADVRSKEAQLVFTEVANAAEAICHQLGLEARISLVWHRLWYHLFWWQQVRKILISYVTRMIVIMEHTENTKLEKSCIFQSFHTYLDARNLWRSIFLQFNNVQIGWTIFFFFFFFFFFIYLFKIDSSKTNIWNSNQSISIETNFF